jgi:hypothetical protein
MLEAQLAFFYSFPPIGKLVFWVLSIVPGTIHIVPSTGVQRASKGGSNKELAGPQDFPRPLLAAVSRRGIADGAGSSNYAPPQRDGGPRARHRKRGQGRR